MDSGLSNPARSWTVADHSKENPEIVEARMMDGSDDAAERGQQPHEPYFFNAECFSGCDDPLCPYIHNSGWAIDGLDGLYESPEAAKAALDAQLGRNSHSLTSLLGSR